MFTISDGTQHIVLIVPAEGVNHIRNLVYLWFVNKSKEHISVAINEAHFALTRHLDLVKFHLNNVGGMLNLLNRRFARLNVKDTNNLR